MNVFTAPIPGESLTAEPGNYPWERPPMYADPEAALQMHLDNITDDKTVDAIVDLLEAGVSVRALTESMLTLGVMGGKHTIDTSMIIGPVVHEYVKMIANSAGVDYTEGFESDDLSENEDMAVASRVNKMLASQPKDSKAGKLMKQTAEMLEGEDAIGIQPLGREVGEMAAEEMATNMEEQPAAAPKRGLMARNM